jgi:hypothetical protein
MKPLNIDEPGCNFTTSNCVIWQGPDIPCISLCKGDTVSNVVYKLATELCQIMDILKIDAYDLSCFNLTSCKPADFQQLLQFLIERICSLESCTGCEPDCHGNTNSPGNGGNNTTGCPDCTVQIAPCFYYQNELGDTVTSMQLVDYVRAIGNRICENVTLTLRNQQTTLNNHELRIQNLENAPESTLQMPEIIPTSVLPSISTPINDVVVALEKQFGELKSATGFSQTIFENIAKQPASINAEKALAGTGETMASLPGWNSIVQNIAQAMGNMWIAINDVRQAVRNIQLNCCPTGCDGITLNMFANIQGEQLNIFVNGVVPSGFLECNGSTNVKVTDKFGNSFIQKINLLTYLNNPSGFTFNLQGTPVNSTVDVTVEIQPCLTNSETQTTCQSYLSYKIANQASCPNVTYRSNTESISYEFVSNFGNYTYTIQIWDAMGVVMVASQTQAVSGVFSVEGTINGLTPGTIYKARLVIVPTACSECEPTQCQFTNISTNSVPPVPPNSES